MFRDHQGSFVGRLLTMQSFNPCWPVVRSGRLAIVRGQLITKRLSMGSSCN